MPSGKKRLSINKIKLHEFFKPIRFSDIEKERIPIPRVNMREPKSGDFDVIDPDSDDEDFDHEYRELYQKDNNKGDSDSDASYTQLMFSIIVLHYIFLGTKLPV